MRQLFDRFGTIAPRRSLFDKKVQNASGVMLDDVVAGLYASLVLLLIHTLI